MCVYVCVSAYLSVCLLLCVCLCVWYVCMGWSEDFGWPSLSFTFLESVLYFCYGVCQGSWFLSCWGFSCLHLPPPQKCWDWRHILLDPDTFYCIQVVWRFWGFKLMSSQLRSKCSVPWVISSDLVFLSVYSIRRYKRWWHCDLQASYLHIWIGTWFFSLQTSMHRQDSSGMTLPLSDNRNALYKVHRWHLPLSLQWHFRYPH